MFNGKLIEVMNIAIERKPTYGQACNHCGYCCCCCCLTEVCATGIQVTGTDVAPCKLIKTEGDNHYCSLGDTSLGKELLGIGEGCCAKTQQEAIEEFMNTGEVVA